MVGEIINPGSYNNMAEQYPDLSDAQILELYSQALNTFRLAVIKQEVSVDDKLSS